MGLKVVQIIVQFGDGGNQTYNNNNISINMYLNENCKNAMSLEDFMQNIKISLQDLDYTTKNGYMAGISNILMNQLCDIAPNERPIHCSDQKRLQFYVKEDDIGRKTKIIKRLIVVLIKLKLNNMIQLIKWMEENPNWQSDPALVDEYQHMVDKIAGPSEQKEKMKLSKKIQKELAKATNIKDEIQKMKRNKLYIIKNLIYNYLRLLVFLRFLRFLRFRVPPNRCSSWFRLLNINFNFLINFVVPSGLVWTSILRLYNFRFIKITHIFNRLCCFLWFRFVLVPFFQ